MSGEPWSAQAGTMEGGGAGGPPPLARHERDSFRELVRHVAYADTPLRDTDAFKLACHSLGWEWDRRERKLFEVRKVAVSDPYAGG